MDFIDLLRNLSLKIQKLQDNIQTEEAAKNAFVLPFIAALGYDVFDPTEVIPEFTADVGIKKGEKVDFAIIKDELPIILIECKPCGAKLEIEQSSQLYRYFSVTKARIAILTDGIRYKFFSDLDEPNKMDAKPFMEFNMLEIHEPFVHEIKKLAKQTFNLDQILSTASELKYTGEIKRVLGRELASPSPEFVKLVASEVYTGRMLPQVVERFTDITKRAFTDFINERINERLRSAMSGYSTAPAQPATNEAPAAPEILSTEDKIVTTQEEIEAFQIVKAILRSRTDVKRISIRDQQTYCGILLDDNNRKPLARLYFNRSNKHIVVINSNREEEKIPILSLDDLYSHADKFLACLDSYEVKA